MTLIKMSTQYLSLPVILPTKEKLECYLSAVNKESRRIAEITKTTAKWTDFCDESLKSKKEAMSLNEIFSLGLTPCEKKMSGMSLLMLAHE